MRGSRGSLLHGARLLAAGFGWWRIRPRTMALGLVPAVIAGALLTVALIAIAFFVPQWADAVTPFADNWPGVWGAVVRIAVGTAMLGAAIVLAAVTFTTLTLIVGEPFYDRIWRTVETRGGGALPSAGYGFWRSTGDALAFFVRGVVVAILTGLCSLIPVVGVLSTVVGVCASGWLLADELTSRALMARGLTSTQRRALLRARRAPTLGFGIATQLCFMIPLGAVITMPAAVAGSTLLARELDAGRHAVDVGAARS